MKRIDFSKLNIGTYYLAPYATTERHICELRECGIDMVVNLRYDKRVLDLFKKYGIGAIITGVMPGWFGGDGSNAGTMSTVNAMERYEAASTAFTDHPAIWGLDTGDEPSCLDFEHYGRVFEYISVSHPEQFAYLNIYPSYGVKGSNTLKEIYTQLGTKIYHEYIEQYCDKVSSEYICFDYYLYSANIAGAYESFYTVSEACRKRKRRMWTVLQVNSHLPDKWISENQLRFQANMALAFGAESIIWACYTAGWWYNHVLDKDGNRTEQYAKLQKINAELHSLEKYYMQYQHVHTYFVGNYQVDEIGSTGQKSLVSLTTDSFKNVKAQADQKLLIGQMKPRQRLQAGALKEALMICAADDPYDTAMQSIRVYFETEADNPRAIGREGDIPIIKYNNLYSFVIHSGEGVLLIG